jgi:hypothetical protein
MNRQNAQGKHKGEHNALIYTDLLGLRRMRFCYVLVDLRFVHSCNLHRLAYQGGMVLVRMGLLVWVMFWPGLVRAKNVEIPKWGRAVWAYENS